MYDQRSLSSMFTGLGSVPGQTQNSLDLSICGGCASHPVIKPLPIGIGVFVGKKFLKEGVEECKEYPRYATQTYVVDIGDEKAITLRTTQIKDIDKPNLFYNDTPEKSSSDVAGARYPNYAGIGEPVTWNKPLTGVWQSSDVFCPTCGFLYSYKRYGWPSLTYKPWPESGVKLVHAGGIKALHDGLEKHYAEKWLVFVSNVVEYETTVKEVFEKKIVLETERFTNRTHENGMNYLRAYVVKI